MGATREKPLSRHREPLDPLPTPHALHREIVHAMRSLDTLQRDYTAAYKHALSANQLTSAESRKPIGHTNPDPSFPVEATVQANGYRIGALKRAVKLMRTAADELDGAMNACLSALADPVPRKR